MRQVFAKKKEFFLFFFKAENKQKTNLHICVQNEIASGVAEGEVVAGQLALL
jgi:hypothetical protein